MIEASEPSEMLAHGASESVPSRLAAVLSRIGGPLAVAVSGGVDSMTLATFVHRVRVPAPKCFTPSRPRCRKRRPSGSKGSP